MLLRKLVEALPCARVKGALDRPIVRVCSDSRLVEPGSIFVALSRGQIQDRHQFINDALSRGAAAIVSEREVACNVTTIVVRDCRIALSQVARTFYNDPADELINVGVTGTNGKTTTAFLTRALLSRCGIPCGYLGTLGYSTDKTTKKIPNTTPEADLLQACLRDFVADGMRAASLEVSSHGLALHRVDGIPFNVAIGTNLTRDHLDFHGDFSAYCEAKAALFTGLSSDAYAVLNADDPHVEAWGDITDAKVITYGMHAQADWQALTVDMMPQGMVIGARTPVGDIEVKAPMLGQFNCYNILASLAAAHSLGIEVERLTAAMVSVESVPGRFESLDEGQEFTLLVDYAHTPDALNNVLKAARTLTEGKLICVFGCGGDRDRGKRPEMGCVAGKWADTLWVTSDNPRSEDPLSIIAEIVDAVPSNTVCETEANRASAIEAALRAASPGDCVVIAGKGHEAEQILNDRVIPFDDRSVARAILQAMKCAN